MSLNRSFYKEECVRVFNKELKEEGFFNSIARIKENRATTFLDIHHEGLSYTIFFSEDNSKNAMMMIPISLNGLNCSQILIDSFAEDILNELKISLKKEFDDDDFKVDNFHLDNSSNLFNGSLGIVIAYFYEKKLSFDDSTHAGLLFNVWLTFHGITTLYLDNLRKVLR